MKKSNFKRLGLATIIFITNCKNEQTQKNFETDSIKYTKSMGDSTNYKIGEAIFISDCSTCHVSKKSTDNLLVGAVQRVGTDYLKLFLTSQDSLIKSANKYAIDLNKEFGNQPFRHHFQFSDKQLNSLVEYLK